MLPSVALPTAAPLEPLATQPTPPPTAYASSASPAWPGRSRSSDGTPTLPISASRTAWPCWSSARRWSATPSGWPPGCGSRACASRPPRRTLIIVPPAASIAACSRKLTGGEWIERHQDLLVTGPTGTGKTWLSCALGHRACRDNRSVLYQRVPRLLEALGSARGDGRYGRMLKTLARVQLLILGDWAITPLTAEQRRDLMEIVDHRHDRASTIVTSQVPVERSNSGTSTSATRRSPTPCSTA